MVKIHQIKDRYWLSGLKCMTQPYAIYSKFTSNITIQAGQRKERNKIYYANNQKKAGMGILIYKVDFRAKKFRNREEYYIMKKGVNPPRKYSSLSCVCTKQQSCKTYEAVTDETEWHSRQVHNYSQRLNTCLATIDKATWQKISRDVYELTTSPTNR